MRRVRFGRTGVEVPAISLGTWAHGGPKVVNDRPVGWFGTDDRLARETLIAAYDLGIDHWDTADVYGGGHAEALMGRVWGDVPREKIFLASKVGWDPGPYGHYYHPEQIRTQLEGSLRSLRTDHLDLYYLHHCDFGPDGEYFDDAFDAVCRFREEGKLRFLGLSDWNDEKILRYADRVRPDVIQCYRNVVDDSYAASGLKQWVEKNDAGVAFFSPLKHALLVGRFEGPVTFGAGDHRGWIAEFRDYALLARLRECRHEMEQRFKDHPEPLLHGLLGALLSDAETACVLLGQREPQHVRAAAKVGDPLSPEEAQWVSKLYQENARLTRSSWRNFQQVR